MPLGRAGALVTDPDTVIIDASTAHRVAEDWAYGFPELCSEQKDIVANSKRIANPGCYPTGMIALTRPLVDAGYLPKGTGLVVHAVSGYSGGGKALMKIHRDGEAEPWGAYGFNLHHKHLPEMAEYSKVGRLDDGGGGLLASHLILCVTPRSSYYFRGHSRIALSALRPAPTPPAHELQAACNHHRCAVRAVLLYLYVSPVDRT